MPNYKLLEELNSSLYNNITVYIEKQDKQYDEQIDRELHKQLYKKFDSQSITYKYTKFAYIRNYVITINKPEYGKMSFVNEFSKELSDLYKKFYNFDIRLYNITFNLVNNVNSYETDFKNIDIFLKEPGTLQNFHKNFPNTDQIVFKNLFNIKGNVLGLLKLKNLTESGILNMASSNPEWFEILKKYMKTKDILGCQDELIDNGFSKYAKL
jgi:hypothetical protein